MKILHTSDWHLGKRLEGISRLDEQRLVLADIERIADEQDVRLVVIAGDIFDTSVPSSEAEELFYETVLKLSKNGRFVVAIAGNHDDADRLSAPGGLAKVSNIILVGGMDNSYYTNPAKRVTGGFGWIKIELGGEKVNLALLPYPSESRMAAIMGDGGIEGNYTDKAAQWLKICGECFCGDGINITVSHLFIAGSQQSEDERELGTAHLLPKSVLPTAQYTALGHIHKPQTVSKSGNAYYSGAILSYSFDDLTEKSVIIADIKAGGVADIKRIALTGGKKLLRFEATAFSQAEEFLKNNQNCYVELTYASVEPLKPSDIGILKKYNSYCKLAARNLGIKQEVVGRKERSPKDLFNTYYKHVNGGDPQVELVDLFLELFNEVAE